MPESNDPRELLRRSLDSAGAIVAGVKADQASDPTPCTEFDVATLTNHLIGAVGRTGSIAEGVPVTGPLEPDGSVPAEGWEASFEAARARALGAWADDALLAKEFTLPWATVPGGAIVTMYAMEAVLHGWDLAVATGQDHLLDDDLAAEFLPLAEQWLPPEHRGGDIPFAPVVEVPDDAPASDRLAGFTGRRRP